MKAKYNQSTHSLEEQPEMKEPDDLLGKAFGQQYIEHIASLKKYDIRGTVPEYWRGEVLEEGKDYLIVDISESEHEETFVAVPMIENKVEDVGQYEYDLTKKIYNQLKHIYDSYANEWTEHNREETARLLYEYEMSDLP